MHAFQCSDSCYTARVCIRSAVKNPEKSSIHVPRLHQTLTQSKHRKPRVSAWTVQPQTLGTDSQGRTDAVSVTVPEDSVAELILHCSRTSALTRATRPNPLADPGLRRADRRGWKKKAVACWVVQHAVCWVIALRRSLDLVGLFPGCPLGQPGPPSLPPHMGPASNSAATLTAEAPPGHIRGTASSQKPPVKEKFETKNLSAVQATPGSTEKGSRWRKHKIK